MTFPATVDKVVSVVRRDLLMASRYRTGFVLPIIGALVEVVAFYFLARAIGPGFRPGGMDYFEFLLIGTGGYTFFVMGISAFLNVVRDAQQTGTIEVLMSTSTPAHTVVFLSALSALVRNALRFLCFLAAGLVLFGFSFRHANLATGATVFFFSFVITAAFGMLAAALQISIQKGSAVLWVFTSGTWFLTGTLFPVNVLPDWLRSVSKLIPVTYSLDGLRAALLMGSGMRTMIPDLLALAGFALVLCPFGLAMFSMALRQARQNGTLTSY